ncbi:MAG: hypothetical protein JXR77_03320, partial [Lentisphaeria bacterium]|nr:hypothetical protein [Lentisphaeria bacterium]
RSPRARDLARRIAFRQLGLAELARSPVLAGSIQFLRRAAFGGQPTEEQDALLWDSGSRACDAYTRGNLPMPLLVQMALAWQGMTNTLGWAGAASGLPPELRGPGAYILGCRYRRLGRAEDARMLFETARAEARENALLARLADAERARQTAAPGKP